MHTAFYLRRSLAVEGKQKHSIAAQRRACLAWHDELDSTTAAVEYLDDGVSGGETKGGKKVKRPAYDRLVAAIAAGEVDTVVVARLDRLARTTRRVVDFMALCEEQGVRFVALDFGADSSTPAGRLVLQIMAAFAEWEREQIRERTRAGLAAARASGKQVGAPRLVVDVEAAKALMKGGRSLRATAKLLGVSHATLRRRLEEAA